MKDLTKYFPELNPGQIKLLTRIIEEENYIAIHKFIGGVFDASKDLTPPRPMPEGTSRISLSWAAK